VSDTYQAPPAPSPAPAAPPVSPVSEAPINVNQQQAPAPVTNTPPPAPGKAPSTRYETITKAFERAKVERKGPAEAKMGHNAPPEPTEVEKPLNLKQRPSEQEQAQELPKARDRGEHGHFVPKADTGGKTPGNDARGQQGMPVAHARPLPRMSPQAQRDWPKAPETVRADVHRMHNEFAQAYQKFRGDHEAMNELRPYHRLAQSQGVKLSQALQNYVGIEEKLRSDPIGGLDVIVNNLNLRTNDGRRLGLSDIAYHVLSQSPEQHRLTVHQNQQAAIAHQLAQVRQQQQALARQQAQMQYQQKFVQTRGAVDRFAETHPRLDELGDLIERELQFGFDLPTAYQRASLLRPGNGTAAQTRSNNSTAPQTRSSDRSISGAPDGGTANRAPRKASGRRESIVNAMRRVNGSL
jgi:hypothetical protein